MSSAVSFCRNGGLGMLLDEQDLNVTDDQEPDYQGELDNDTDYQKWLEEQEDEYASQYTQ